MGPRRVADDEVAASVPLFSAAVRPVREERVAEARDVIRQRRAPEQSPKIRAIGRGPNRGEHDERFVAGPPARAPPVRSRRVAVGPSRRLPHSARCCILHAAGLAARRLPYSARCCILYAAGLAARRDEPRRRRKSAHPKAPHRVAAAAPPRKSRSAARVRVAIGVAHVAAALTTGASRHTSAAFVPPVRPTTDCGFVSDDTLQLAPLGDRRDATAASERNSKR
mmetsp:Transcript_24049/g.75180  ORF Transcript_24049/g.75180 Transcript_24049/m.75180 type:complete len:224 (-) Transcript_24049:57-728(-)